MLELIDVDSAKQLDFAELNPALEKMSPIQRVEWAFKHLPSTHVVSSSFGAQSAVMLHLINDVAPGTPVILTDTGYLFGKQWENGIEGIENYNKINKVEPMRRALSELEAGTWFAGLRRSQSDSRENLAVLAKQAGQFKVHPIIDQSNKQLHEYLKQNNLPYHPLWEKGYVSIGDWHTTQSLQEGMSEQDTRFFGMKRECGLHEFGDGDGI
jgi:phosphoadenosine phosphosulfate reductase